MPSLQTLLIYWYFSIGMLGCVLEAGFALSRVLDWRRAVLAARVSSGDENNRYVQYVIGRWMLCMLQVARCAHLE